jgi:hypothetical protein
MAIQKVPLLGSELLEHVAMAVNMTEEVMHCIQSYIDSRQCIQKLFHSHGNEPSKHSNSEECDNSTVEGGDLHTVRPEPTLGREFTNRRQTKIRSEVFILCDVLTLTF